jgi:nucleotide-binding universal stress UspA family protein
MKALQTQRLKWISLLLKGDNMLFKNILIATDGSEPSRQAARAGIDLARLAGAEVAAIYVVDIVRLVHLPGYTAMPGIKDSILELMFAEAEKATSEVEKMAEDASVPCRRVVAQGDPSEEILKAAQGMDLLVMGSVGRSGLEKILLGSVAEKVVHRSQIPVLVIPGYGA